MMLKVQRPASTTEATTRAHCAHRTATSGAVPRDHLQLTSCWNDEGFQFGGEVSSDHLFSWWYTQGCGHGIAGEGWF